jgi:photosystem II stability/assembly factor-like uncharacterized protein
MNRSVPLFLAILLLLGCSKVLAQTAAFTYQGKLTTGGAAANVPHDFIFKLFSLPASGTQVASDVVRDDVPVTAGSFTVSLDFGSLPFISATGNYLEIWVRLGTDTGAYTTLTPRQPITSSPFAIRTISAESASAADSLSESCFMCVSDGNISAIDGSKVVGPVATASTAGNVTGVVPIANGGTGSSTQNFVDTTTNQFVSGDKIFSGNVTTLFGGRFNGDGRGLTNVPGTMTWQAIFSSSQAVRNNGYLASSSSQLMLTLPPSASMVPGDTVRISGAGTGGWKIAQNADQSVLGANLGSIGLDWTPRESQRPWRSIASSADGSKLVALAQGGLIYTSTDSGVSWTPRESARQWYAAASSADGSKLVAVVNNGGQIYTSTDSGVSWIPRESNRNWYSVASSADGTKLVAGTNLGQIYTSTDSGVTWTPRDTNRVWRSVASSADGTKLAAAVPSGQIYTSSDSGVTWVPRGNPGAWQSVASSADGTKLVAVGNFMPVYTSTDSGVTWTPRGLNVSRNAVASSADGSKLVAVANGGRIYTSVDSGVSWTARENDRNWYPVASSADGSKLIAGVDIGLIYTVNQNTTPGVGGYLTGAQFTAVELQYIGNGQFIPLSHAGTISIF